MKWRLGILLALLTALLVIVVVPAFRTKAEALLSYSECDTPLPYKIGSIDPRFGLSQGDVLGDITQATNIWNTAEGKTLFAYSPKAQLTVNFVYDQRQALNSQIQQLDTNLSQRNSTLQQKINDFKAQQAAYEQKVAAFNALIRQYNSQGGVPKDVYDSLVQQQNELNSEAQSLNATARQLNLSTSDYNAGVSSLYQDIHQLNTELAQKPEEGLYSSDLTITIYLTNSQAELVHTLAHEFGHALGMVHVDGKTSIMYPYTSSSLTVTPYDIQQLTYVCREQSLIVHEIVVFDEWLFPRIQSLGQYFRGK